jgi:hypothetical protein
MKYFLIFGERENLRIAKDAKISFESAIRILNRQNQSLLKERKVGYVQAHLVDLNEDLSVLFDLDLPVENVTEYLLNQILLESEDFSLVEQLKMYLPNQLGDTLEFKDELIEQTEIEKNDDSVDVEKADNDTNYTEQSTEQSETLVESKSQHDSFERSTVTRKKEERKPVNLKKSLPFKIKTGVVITTVGFLALLSLTAIQSHEIKELNNRIDYLDTVNNQEHKLDIFVRYFLPNYFSSSNEKSGLKKYVSNDVYKKIKVQNAVTQSAFMESVEKNQDQTYNVSYILVVQKGEDNQTETIRLELKLKPFNNKLGYILDQEPSMTKFDEE